MSTLELLKALADETRLRIVSLVAEAGDLCACEIETLLGLGQSNASRHLARLRQSGVLVARRSGQWIHYAPTTGHAAEAPVGGDSAARTDERAAVIDAAISAARRDSPVLRVDLERLADYRGRGFSCETIREWHPPAAR
jgi:ArsR family transcriptional regulator, arsenate/arsenite/antimonite-responsive transcriptional repressor